MITFPQLTPTSRRITQGEYAVKRFTAISGTGFTRAYGSQPFNSSIDLEFSNVNDTDALSVIRAYEACRGSYAALALPSSIWDGMEDSLRSALERDYTWRFSEQPVITSSVPGVSTITVRLDGQRDG